MLSSYTLASAVTLAVSAGLSNALAIDSRALTCGGDAFTLRVKSSVSYLDGGSIIQSNYSSREPYLFAGFGGSGVVFKLNRSCQLVVNATGATAQIYPGVQGRNHPVEFAKGTGHVNGQTLVTPTCAISTQASTLNQFTCDKAGSLTGLKFASSRGTEEASKYEIGQELLILGKLYGNETSVRNVTLTAIKV